MPALGQNAATAVLDGLNSLVNANLIPALPNAPINFNLIHFQNLIVNQAGHLNEIELKTLVLDPLNDTQQFVASGTRLQIINNAKFVLDLSAGDAAAQNRWLNELIRPSMGVVLRTAMKDAISSLIGTGTPQLTKEINILLSTMKIEKIVQQELSQSEKENLFTVVFNLFRKREKTIISKSIESLTSGNANASPVTLLLLKARGNLRTKISRWDKASTFSGIIIGALVASLEALRQTGFDNDNVNRSLLILPIILGTVSAICLYYRDAAKKEFRNNTLGLNMMGVDPLNEEGKPQYSPAR